MFKIHSLSAEIKGKSLFSNMDLTINDGEIHVLMGKNGIGKSSLCRIIMNYPGYSILGGSIVYNNQDLLSLSTSEIAKKGIFLISQNPLSIEGVSNAEVLRCALREKNDTNINIFEFNKSLEKACERLNLDKSFIHRDINVGASGGERKKVELMHVDILKPNFLLLDEIDSGLDVDALKDVCEFIKKYHEETKASILIITHHSNIIDYIKPNFVHILDGGHIIKTGDYHLAYDIEKEGYNEASIIDQKDLCE